jgi:hypothetical protein
MPAKKKTAAKSKAKPAVKPRKRDIDAGLKSD